MIKRFRAPQDSSELPSPSIGNGTITEIIRPNQEWRISFNASYWFARADYPLSLQIGDRVRVLDFISATTLLIDLA
jgi:membrane protein implicated in regulation of membrane protease activity